MLHRSWTNGDETFYLARAQNIVGSEKWKSLQPHGVEPEHARFDYDSDNNCYWLRDLSSETGVRVNGIPISISESVRINDGDQITFGKSPEYTFLLSPSAAPSEGSVVHHHPRLHHRPHRQYSSDETIENGGPANLAVDSAPSVNGGPAYSVASLPRLHRGRSPAGGRRSFAHLPVSTLVDGRRVSPEPRNAAISVNSRHWPNVITYRQRQFLRQNSADGKAPRKFNGEKKTAVTPIAWDDYGAVKEATGTSASSVCSFTNGDVRHHSHKQIGNVAHSLQINELSVIRQLNNRVQQLEEALRHHPSKGQNDLQPDSGLSSASSDPKKAVPTGDQKPDHKGGPDLEQHVNSLSADPDHAALESSKEVMRLRAALAASERQRTQLEGMLTIVNQSGSNLTTNTDSINQRSPSQTSNTHLNVSPNPAPIEDLDLHLTEHDHENDSPRKVSDNESLMVHVDENEIPQKIEADLEEVADSRCTGTVCSIPWADTDSQVHIQATQDSKAKEPNSPKKTQWHEFLRDEEERKSSTNSIPPSPLRVQIEEPKEYERKIDEQNESKKEMQNANSAPVQILTKEEACSNGGRREAEIFLQRCRVEVLLLLETFFAEEISALSDTVFNNADYDYDQLLADSLECKIRKYKNRLLSVILKLKNSLDGNPFPVNDHVQVNEEFWDYLCNWAVQRCSATVEATHKLMPVVAGILKKRAEENDAKSKLNSWISNLQANQEGDLNPRCLKEAAESLRKHDTSYWQKDLIVSLLLFVSEHATLNGSKQADQCDQETNTDISQEDFNKLISDIADLLDEKEHLRVTNTNLQNELSTKRNAFEEMKERMTTLESDLSLLREDNRNLAEAKGDLIKKMEALENEKCPTENAIIEQCTKKEVDAEHQHAEPMLDTTPSAREELEYLKRKIAELGSTEMDASNDQRLNYIQDFEAKDQLLEQLEDTKRLLHEKDVITSNLEKKIAELEQKNSEINTSVREAPQSDGSSDLQQPSANDQLFWTLSEKLGKLLQLDGADNNVQNGQVSSENTLNDNHNGSGRYSYKEPDEAAQDITQKVQQLLDRLNLQNEELDSYRSSTSNNLGMEARPHVETTQNGNIVHIEDGSHHRQNMMPSPEKSAHRSSRSGSLKFRRHRSQSPQLVNIPSNVASSRECHACDILKARRRQQELIQAAKIQAHNLTTARQDSYPLKVVTFKLPNSVPGGGNQQEIDDNQTAFQ